MATYQPNPQRAVSVARATDLALQAGAQVVQNDVKLRFRTRKHGYTTGAFARPGRGVTAMITRSEPQTTSDGTRRVTVGTNARSADGYPYPLAWELGHRNVFTGNHERVETFRPALFDNAQRVQDAFARVFKRVMDGAR
jgi:hypothetical protein